MQYKMQTSGAVRVALLLGASVALAACATRHHVAQADWDLGAREGRIVRAYDGADGVALPRCLALLPPAARAGRRFVQVRYHAAKHDYFDVAELPVGVDGTIGAHVEIWPADCSAGQMARIAQLVNQQPD